MLLPTLAVCVFTCTANNFGKLTLVLVVVVLAYSARVNFKKLNATVKQAVKYGKGGLCAVLLRLIPFLYFAASFTLN